MISRILVFCFLFVAPFAGQIRVVNDGCPGQNTAELDSRLDDALIKFKPDYVILFAGANDALNEKKFLSIQESKAHLENIVHRVQTHGAQVVMVTIHDPDLNRLMERHKPRDYGSQPPLQRLKELNLQVEEIAALNHAKLVPFSMLLTKAGGANSALSTDGVHLTAKGYALLARAVRKELPQNVPPNTTILCFGDSLTYGIGVRSPNHAQETSDTYPAQLRALLK